MEVIMREAGGEAHRAAVSVMELGGGYVAVVVGRSPVPLLAHRLLCGALVPGWRPGERSPGRGRTLARMLAAGVEVYRSA